MDSCDGCGFVYDEVDPRSVAKRLRSYPPQYRDAMSGVADVLARRRPEATVWSALEYLCHVIFAGLSRAIQAYSGLGMSVVGQACRAFPCLADGGRYPSPIRDVDAVASCPVSDLGRGWTGPGFGNWPQCSPLANAFGSGGFGGSPGVGGGQV